MKKRLGNYELERLLGQGGMGAVYLAHDTLLDRCVALKILPSEFSRVPKYQQRFLREARAAARLVHPNLVVVYNVGQEDDTYYIAMEYVVGCNLQEHIENKGPLAVNEALQILKQAASGIWAAHQQGIVHRDIKPANILITPQGQVKVADFGLARIIQESGLTQQGVLMGTPQYMSPEQCEGEPAGPQSDIYSLGLTFYYTLAGHPPYQAESALALLRQHVERQLPELQPDNPQITPAIRSILAKMTAKSLAERYHDMAAMLQDLETLPIPAVGSANDRTVLLDSADQVLSANISAPERQRTSPKPSLPTGYELTKPAESLESTNMQTSNSAEKAQSSAAVASSSALECSSPVVSAASGTESATAAAPAASGAESATRAAPAASGAESTTRAASAPQRRSRGAILKLLTAVVLLLLVIHAVWIRKHRRPHAGSQAPGEVAPEPAHPDGRPSFSGSNNSNLPDHSSHGTSSSSASSSNGTSSSSASSSNGASSSSASSSNGTSSSSASSSNGASSSPGGSNDHHDSTEHGNHDSRQTDKANQQGGDKSAHSGSNPGAAHNRNPTHDVQDSKLVKFCQRHLHAAGYRALKGRRIELFYDFHNRQQLRDFRGHVKVAFTKRGVRLFNPDLVTSHWLHCFPFRGPIKLQVIVPRPQVRIAWGLLICYNSPRRLLPFKNKFRRLLPLKNSPRRYAVLNFYCLRVQPPKSGRPFTLTLTKFYRYSDMQTTPAVYIEKAAIPTVLKFGLQKSEACVRAWYNQKLVLQGRDRFPCSSGGVGLMLYSKGVIHVSSIRIQGQIDWRRLRFKRP